MTGNKDLNFPGYRRADWQLQQTSKIHPSYQTSHTSRPSTQSRPVALPRPDAGTLQTHTAAAVRTAHSVQVVEPDDDEWDGWDGNGGADATINNGVEVPREELYPQQAPVNLVDPDYSSDDSAGSIPPGKMVDEDLSSDGLVMSDNLDDESIQQSLPVGFPNLESKGSRSTQSISARLPPDIPTQSNKNDTFRVPSTSTMPPGIAHQINAWCQKYRLLEPPPITSTAKYDTLTSTKSGKWAHFVYKTGESIKMYKFPLGEKSNLVVAQVHGRYPAVICSTKKWEGKAHSGCTYYQTWIGVKGDRDGFANEIEFAKCFTPDFVPSLFRSTLAPGELSRAKKRELSSSPGFHEAEELPGSPSSAQSGRRALFQRRPRATQQAEVLKDADSFPKKRKRTDTDSKETEDKSINRQSTPRTIDLPLNTSNKHIRSNTVLLFFSAHSPTPRVRLLHAIDTAKELFAQALAGDLFDEPLPHGHMVLLAKLGPSRRALRILESDEEDYWDLFVAIKALPCWVTTPGGGVEGSCTVEIRAIS